MNALQELRMNSVGVRVDKLRARTGGDTIGHGGAGLWATRKAARQCRKRRAIWFARCLAVIFRSMVGDYTDAIMAHKGQGGVSVHQ